MALIILFLSMGYALFNDSLTFESTGIIGLPEQPKLSHLVYANEEPTLNIAAKFLNLPKNQEIKFSLEAKLN